MIAKDFATFTDKTLQTIQTFLNDTASGQELSDYFRKTFMHYYARKIFTSNTKPVDLPTEKDWANAQQSFMVFLFFQMIEFDPLVKAEFISHLFNELKELKES